MSPRSLRPRQRGAVLLATMLAVLCLLLFGGVAVLALRRSLPAAGERGPRVARRAAEAGLAAGLEWLHGACDPAAPLATVTGDPGPAVPGNGARPGEPGATLDPATNAWYRVTFMSDASGARVRATGFGPHGASATLEARVVAPTCEGFSVAGWRDVP